MRRLGVGSKRVGGLAPISLIKAWVEVTVSGGVPSLGDNFNITGSVTDNGVGDFTVTLDRDFANDTYAVAGAVAGTSADAFVVAYARAAGTLRFQTMAHAGTLADYAAQTLILIGDQ